MPHKLLKLIVLLSLASFSIGCRNQCSNCGVSPWRPFAPLATRVPAPPTYTLNVPQTAQQQPYYTAPAGTAAGGVPANPAGAIPTYQAQPSLAPQPGWRAANPNGAVTNPNLNPTSFNRPATGISQTLNPNYQTTTIDESRSSSRLAVTDASQVRAPARFFPTGNMTRLAQSPVATSGAAVPNPGFANQVVGFGQPANNQLNLGQGPTVINGSADFYGQPVIANRNYGVNPYANQTAQGRVFNNPVTSTNPTVLAQGTTSRTNVASNTQAGWRDSQVYGSGANLNR